MCSSDLLLSKVHTGARVLYYEAHEAPRLHCLAPKVLDAAEHHGRCSLGGVNVLTGAGAATTRVGGGRSRRQRQVAVGGGRNRKGFSNPCSKGRGYHSRTLNLFLFSTLGIPGPLGTPQRRGLKPPGWGELSCPSSGDDVTTPLRSLSLPRAAGLGHPSPHRQSRIPPSPPRLDLG